MRVLAWSDRRHVLAANYAREAIPACSRTHWAAADRLWETQTATSSMRSRLAAVAATGRRASTSARAAGSAEPDGDQQRAEFVAVQRGGVRLVVQAGPSDMDGGRMLEQVFFDGVFAEPSDGAQAAGDGGRGAAAGFQIAGEALDVGTARLEQAQVVLLAPAGVPAQVSACASRVRPV